MGRRNHCRVCGGLGHNRQTCPSNPYKNTYNLSYKKERICSVCHESGHNSKTCLIAKKANELYSADCEKAQKSIRDHIIEYNIKIGELIQEPRYNGSSKVYLITGITNDPLFFGRNALNRPESWRNQIFKAQHAGNDYIIKASSILHFRNVFPTLAMSESEYNVSIPPILNQKHDFRLNFKDSSDYVRSALMNPR